MSDDPSEGLTQLSTEDFRRQLESELRQICADRRWQYDTECNRGWAFQFWLGDLLRSRDIGIDTDLEDGVLLTREGEIDIVLQDETERVVYLVQSKLVSLAQKPPMEVGEVEAFFSQHSQLMDRQWVRAHLNHRIFDIIGFYSDLFSEGYKVIFYFVSTGRDASGKAAALSELLNKRHRADGVEFHVLDFPALKAFYLEAKTLQQRIPEEVQFHVRSDQCFIKQTPRRTLAATVKGNSLVNLYRKHKETLFAYNIRSFLGRKGLNKLLIETVETRSNDFFYFNNGISATCTHLSYNSGSGEIRALKFQIINGAQTVGSLAHADVAPEVEVLVRITEGESTVTEKGFNADVIKYNNTQNVVKSSDFRSNDSVQL